MLQLSNLNYRYRSELPWVLQEFSLQLPQQGILGLLGHNGAGKSTLLSIIAGLYQTQQGEVRDLTSGQVMDSKNLLNQVSLVPQDFAFYQELTVQQNLDLFYKIAERQQQATSLQQVIQTCQLKPLLNKPAYSLSGGQKRRLNLAIGLIKQARILLLDEPTVGIDPESKQSLLATIRQIADQGKCIVFTSHILSEVESLVDQICILHQGELKLAPTQLSQLGANQQASLWLKDNDYKQSMQQLLENYTCQWFKQDLCMVKGLDFHDYVVLLSKLNSQQIPLAATSYGTNALESAYLALTGSQPWSLPLRKKSYSYY